MPAVSKAQQKFMGMVHAAQKGEKPASSKVAKVAKKMKKKSAKDFASTKHKGLPYKVKQEILNRLRELVRQELEENFYDGTKKFEKKRTKNAEVLGYKLTGTPDVKTELSSTKGEERVLKRLGDTLKEELYNSQGTLTDFKKGDLVKDINPDCPHHGSEGEVTKVGKGTIFFKVTNDGKTYSEGDELEKTVDQMVKIKESVKKEEIAMLEAKFTDDTLASRIKHWRGKHKGTGIGYGHVLAHLAVHMKEMGWNKSYKEVASIAKELGKKKTVESVNEAKKLSQMNNKELIKHWVKKSKELEVMKSRKKIDKFAYRVESGKIARILNHLWGLQKDMKESVNEAIEPQGNIKKVLDVNKTKTAKKIGGTLVDITTANMMSQVWDKVNDKSKEKMNKMNTRQLTNLILKLWNALGTPRV